MLSSSCPSISHFKTTFLSLAVNFTALAPKFTMICCSLLLSAYTEQSATFTFRCKRTPFFSASGCRISRVEKMILCSETICGVSCNLSFSILDISKTSSTNAARCLDAVSIFSKQSNTGWLSAARSFAISLIPTIALIGVRISCDIRDRNSLLALCAYSAALLARSAAASASAKLLLNLACWRVFKNRKIPVKLKANTAKNTVPATRKLFLINSRQSNALCLTMLLSKIILSRAPASSFWIDLLKILNTSGGHFLEMPKPTGISILTVITGIRLAYLLRYLLVVITIELPSIISALPLTTISRQLSKVSPSTICHCGYFCLM